MMKAMSDRRPKVFLCHASADKSRVRHLFHSLQAAGAEPWLDEENLLPGQDWRTEIARAIREADFFVACLSTRAVDRRGYFQKEIRAALDVLDEMPDRVPYLIPLRLDDCDLPSRLQSIHRIDYFHEDPAAFAKLMRTIRATFGNRNYAAARERTPTNIGPHTHIDTNDRAEAEAVLIERVAFELGMKPLKDAKIGLPTRDVRQAFDGWTMFTRFTAVFEDEETVVGLIVRFMKGNKARLDAASDAEGAVTEACTMQLRGAPRVIKIIAVFVAPSSDAAAELTRSAAVTRLEQITSVVLPPYDLRVCSYGKTTPEEPGSLTLV